MELIRAVLYTADAEIPLRQADENLHSLSKTENLQKRDTLSANLRKGSDEWEKFQRRRLLKVDYGGRPNEWWRIVKVSDRGADQDPQLTLWPRYWDLNDTMAYVPLSSGARIPTVTVTGVTVSNALDRVLNKLAAPDLYVPGDVQSSLQGEFVYVWGEGVTHWKLLQDVASEVNGRVNFEWTGTEYKVHVVERVGEDDPINLTDQLYRSGIDLRDFSQTSDDSKYFSEIVPVGGQKNETFTVAEARWVVGSSSYDSGEDETTVTLEDAPVWLDGALVGRDMVGETGTAYEVLSSTRPDTIVVSGDATTEGVVQFQESDGADLVALRYPGAEREAGKAQRVDRLSQIPPPENLLVRAGVTVTADDLTGWDPVGSGTLTIIGDLKSTNHGSGSIKVTGDAQPGSGAPDGVETATVDFQSSEFGPYASAYVAVRVVTGAIGVQLRDSAGNVFPPESDKIVGGEDQIRGYSLGGFKPEDGPLKLRIFCREDGTEFHVDSATITPTSGAQKFSPLMGPRALWKEAGKILRREGGIRPPRMDARTLTLTESPFHRFLEAGDDVIVFTEKGLRRNQDVEVRVRSVTTRLDFNRPDWRQKVQIGQRPANFAEPDTDRDSSPTPKESADTVGRSQPDFEVSADGLDVTFTDTSKSPDGSVEKVEWDFGNGVVATGSKVKHAYDTAGTYSVVQKITDSDGFVETKVKDVTVSTKGDSAPVGNFSVVVDHANLKVTLTDESNDRDADLSSFDVDWGDGNSDTGQTPGSQISHTYGSSGTYTVTVTAQDSGGRTDSISRDVQVDTGSSPSAPTAGFTSDVSSKTDDSVKVDFLDESTEGDGVLETWLWDFGDGATSSEQSPTHTYQSGGDYTVTLKIIDSNGLESEVTKTVSVATR